MSPSSTTTEKTTLKCGVPLVVLFFNTVIAISAIIVAVLALQMRLPESKNENNVRLDLVD